MLSALISVAFAGFVATLLGGAGAVLARPRWVARPHLAPAYGLGAFGLAALLCFIGFWVHPVAGIVVSVVLVTGSVVVLVRARLWRLIRPAVPLLALASASVILVVSIAYLGSSAFGTFYLAAVRFTDGSYPPDNSIPYLLAERMASGAGTHDLIAGWNGSDRPPLQAGFILIIRGLTGLLGHSEGFAFGASIVAQALWIPAMAAFLRGLGVTRPATTVAIALGAVMGSSIFNTLYTWPKLMSAAFVLASAALLLDARRHPRSLRTAFAAAGVLFALALLAHGAAAFTAPLLIILGVLAFRRQRAAVVLGGMAAAASAGLVVYLPWLLYQRFADPPGDRLVKWHLAGVIDPDGRSFAEALIDSFSNLTLGEWLAGRWVNIQVAFAGDPLSTIGCWCFDDISRRRTAEFFTMSGALGLALPALAIVVVAIGVTVVRRRRLGRGDARTLLLIVASLACVAFWCLLMFIPGTTVVHQGSHVWLLILTVVPAIWLHDRRPVLAWVLVAAQLVMTLVVYAPFPRADHVAPLAVAGIALALAMGTVVAARSKISSTRITRIRGERN